MMPASMPLETSNFESLRPSRKMSPTSCCRLQMIKWPVIGLCGSKSSWQLPCQSVAKDGSVSQNLRCLFTSFLSFAMRPAVEDVFQATDTRHARHWLIMISILGGLLLQVVVWISLIVAARRRWGHCPAHQEAKDIKPLYPKARRKDIRRVFGGGFPWGQLAIFAWRLARASVNMSYQIHTCISKKPIQVLLAELQQAQRRPSQSSSELWDFERHVVILVEGVLALTIVFFLIAFLSSCLRNPQPNSEHRTLRMFLDRACSFSAFNLLPMANPLNAMERVQRQAQVEHTNVYVQRGLSIMTFTFIVMVAIPLAAMSVVVKVSKLGFVVEDHPWTFSDMLACAMFINSLAGLRGGIEREKERAIFEWIGQGTYNLKVHEASMRTVFYQLREWYGPYAGLAIFATLSPTQICKLLSRVEKAPCDGESDLESDFESNLDRHRENLTSR